MGNILVTAPNKRTMTDIEYAHADLMFRIRPKTLIIKRSVTKGISTRR